MVDWMADFYQNIEDLPVKSGMQPGALLHQLPTAAPEKEETQSAIFADFENLILPGMTHWQHPRFFAYFPANGSLPSLLAEMLTATLGAQCMIWETSPAAAELEQRMMEWLRDLIGLPAHYEGVIQDTASTATLASLLTAREKASGWQIRSQGFEGQPVFRVYASADAHSSIDKAVFLSGIGSANLVKIPTDDRFAMDADALAAAIRRDREAGYQPLAVVATFGTTSTTALDPLEAIADICEKEQIWFHIDAAYGGSALLLPEIRPLAKGMERCDSFVFNPHKWMMVHFDCSAYFVRDKESLLRTFEILPEYLKTGSRGQVNDYRDWGVPLGRRFRALKLWYVLRSYGVEGIQQKIRDHIAWTQTVEQWIVDNPQFELLAPRTMNLVCFRWTPAFAPESQWNQLNLALLQSLNASGFLYLSHTKLGGTYTLRLVFGQTTLEFRHVEEAWNFILTTCSALESTFQPLS